MFTLYLTFSIHNSLLAIILLLCAMFLVLSTLLPTFSIPVSDYSSPVCCVYSSVYPPSYI
jgi:hypothetical protein